MNESNESKDEFENASSKGRKDGIDDKACESRTYLLIIKEVGRMSGQSAILSGRSRKSFQFPGYILDLRT